MNLVKKTVAATLMVAALGSPAFAAGAAVRPGASVAQVNGTLLPQLVSGARVGRSIEKKQGLLGAPIFLAILGGVAVTVGTIVVATDNNSSPG